MVTSGSTDIAPQRLAQQTTVPLASHDIGAGRPITIFRADPTSPYGRVAVETVSTGGTFYSVGTEEDVLFRTPAEAQQYASVKGQIGTVVGQSYAVSPTGAVTPVSSEQYWAAKTAKEEAAKASFGGVRTETMLAPKGAVLDAQKAVSSGAVPGYVLETPKGKEYFLTEQAANIRAMQLAPKPGEPGYHATEERPLGLYQTRELAVPRITPPETIFREGGYPTGAYLPKPPEMITQPVYDISKQITQKTSEFAEFVFPRTGMEVPGIFPREFMRGVVKGAGSVPEMFGTSIYGTEMIIRDVVKGKGAEVAGTTLTGLAIMAAGMKKSFMEAPIETAGTFAGQALVLGGVGKVTGKVGVSISEKLPTISTGKPKGVLIEAGEVPVSEAPYISPMRRTVPVMRASIKGELPEGSTMRLPTSRVMQSWGSDLPMVAGAASGWQAYASKPTTKETVITERELMGTPESTLGDITFERTIKQPVAKVYIKPPESAIGDIMNRITGQIEYVKTPEGSFMKIKPAGVSESISSDISGLSRQISEAPETVAIGEAPKQPSVFSLPSLSRYIRLERKLSIEPTTISKKVIPSRPALPEVTWDIEMGKEAPQTGKTTEYDIYGGRATGKGMQPTEPLVSGVPERLQLAPREVSEFDVGLSMMRKERAAAKPEVSVTKPTPSEQATIDLAESVRTSLEEPISTYEAPTVTRPSVTMKAESQLKPRIKVSEAPTTEFKIESQPLMTKAEQQAISTMGIGGVPVGVVTPSYTKGLPSPQIADISITAKYFGINPADVNLFGYSDMTFIEPTGSLQPYPIGLPRPTPGYYPTPYPRYAPTPYPTPEPYPYPYPSFAPLPAPRPSPYPEPSTGYPDIWGGIGIGEPVPKVKFFEDERKKRKAKPRKKEAYTLGYRATPLIEPLVGIKDLFKSPKYKKTKKSKKVKK